MKHNYLIIILISVFLFASCIRDEALNAEADIEYCIIKDKDILKNPADTMFKANTDHGRIIIRVKADTDLSQLAPEFILTPGATIFPPSGQIQNFDNGSVRYTVTSEDKKWSKTYEVGFDVSEIVTDYYFEHFELETNKKYYQWYEVINNDMKQYVWATGNPGFAIAKADAKPDAFPTVPYMAGVRGNGIKLETMKTGAFGSLMGMPLAAGNLFMGTFDPLEAIKGKDGALKATKFGTPFPEKPILLKGWYKYKAGEEFQSDGIIIPGKKDECNVYGVLYENTTINENGNEISITLDGTNVLTSPNVVGIAQIHDMSETDNWTEFEIPFIYLKDVNMEKLLAYKYNVTIVFTSSKDGATFSGAVGSTLCIDEVALVCVKE